MFDNVDTCVERLKRLSVPFFKLPYLQMDKTAGNERALIGGLEYKRSDDAFQFFHIYLFYIKTISMIRGTNLSNEALWELHGRKSLTDHD